MGCNMYGGVDLSLPEAKLSDKTWGDQDGDLQWMWTIEGKDGCFIRDEDAVPGPDSIHCKVKNEAAGTLDEDGKIIGLWLNTHLIKAE